MAIVIPNKLLKPPKFLEAFNAAAARTVCDFLQPFRHFLAIVELPPARVHRRQWSALALPGLRWAIDGLLGGDKTPRHVSRA